METTQLTTAAFRDDAMTRAMNLLSLLRKEAKRHPSEQSREAVATALEMIRAVFTPFMASLISDKSKE